MKNVFFAAMTLLAASMVAEANTVLNTTNTIGVSLNSEDQDKLAVKLEELPEEVQNTLAGENYKGWKPVTAFLVKGKTVYYEINLINEAKESTTVKLSEKGAPVK